MERQREGMCVKSTGGLRLQRRTAWRLGAEEARPLWSDMIRQCQIERNLRRKHPTCSELSELSIYTGVD
jgi:hypothetical protein|eukprot:COSAG06_NODE_1918_length_8067_cov_10.737952_3_plen_69_part_00